jgi:exopolysaccharide biosynthesis polyprenyl glycosylphosphotransferase
MISAMVSDVAVTILSFLLTFHLLIGPLSSEWWAGLYAKVFALVVVIWGVVFTVGGCYRVDRSLSWRVRLFRILQALVMSHLVLSVVIFYAKQDQMSRAFLVLFFAINLIGLVTGRALVAWILGLDQGIRTLILGAGPTAFRLSSILVNDSIHEIVGYVASGAEMNEVSEGAVLGRMDQVPQIIEENLPIDEVAVALPQGKREGLDEVLKRVEARGLTIRQVIEPEGGGVRKTTMEKVEGLYILTSHASPASLPELLLKRSLDILGGLVGLSLFALMFPFVAWGIKRSSPGPIFYGQTRAGLNGHPFTLYKLRTMIVGAHAMQDELQEENEAKGPHFKMEVDPRVTPIGRFLRKTSLDEFPQFWNVLKGDMSLVGPRPFDVREVEKYNWEYHKRLGVRPGLTCIWQVGGRSEVEDFEEIVRMDEEYIREWSLWLDVKLIFQTIPAVLVGRGAK